MYQGYIENFDIVISDIKLAHKWIFMPGDGTNCYANGRGIFGITFALSGMAEYNVGRKKYEMQKGDIAFIPSHLAYMVKNVSNDQYHHFTANFLLASPDESSGPITSILNAEAPCIFRVKNETMYRNLIDRLTSIWVDKKPGYKMLSMSLLYEILFEYFKEYMVRSLNMGLVEKLAPAKCYIDANPVRSISLEELAGMCGMSVTGFRRSFKSVYGVSPIKYQTELRIQNAKDLLHLNIHSINEISQQCGFEDANYFSRLFKKYTGLSPSEFQKA